MPLFFLYFNDELLVAVLEHLKRLFTGTSYPGKIMVTMAMAEYMILVLKLNLWSGNFAFSGGKLRNI